MPLLEKYEKPRVLRLEKEMKGSGYCTTAGSGDALGCSDVGNGAFIDGCGDGYTPAESNCTTGSSAPTSCNTGNSPTTSCGSGSGDI
jgi:hypothetical protein